MNLLYARRQCYCLPLIISNKMSIYVSEMLCTSTLVLSSKLALTARIPCGALGRVMRRSMLRRYLPARLMLIHAPTLSSISVNHVSAGRTLTSPRSADRQLVLSVLAVHEAPLSKLATLTPRTMQGENINKMDRD